VRQLGRKELLCKANSWPHPHETFSQDIIQGAGWADFMLPPACALLRAVGVSMSQPARETVEFHLQEH